MSETNQKRASGGELAVVFPGWPRTRVLPPDPAVEVLFVGLIAFAYSRRHRRAEIVFNDGDLRHNLRIDVTEGDEPVPLDLPSPIRQISLGLGSGVNVSFLEGGAQDFGRLIDLNSDEFYPGKSPSDPFGIKLVVTHGTFYTAKLSRFRFGRVFVPPIPFPPVGVSGGENYAEHIGLAIDLAADQHVALVVNETAYRFPAVAGRKVKIRFDNECRESSSRRCIHKPGSWLERERGDFHYHREILPLSPFEDRFGLVLAGGQLSDEGVDLITDQKPDSNDLAPCMGAGYGGSEGLPPSS